MIKQTNGSQCACISGPHQFSQLVTTTVYFAIGLILAICNSFDESFIRLVSASHSVDMFSTISPSILDASRTWQIPDSHYLGGWLFMTSISPTDHTYHGRKVGSSQHSVFEKSNGLSSGTNSSIFPLSGVN